jgi:hypothetical protein
MFATESRRLQNFGKQHIEVPLSSRIHARGPDQRQGILRSARVRARKPPARPQIPTTLHGRSTYASLSDLYQWVKPLREELEIKVRAGALAEFGQTRTRHFWGAQHLNHPFHGAGQPGQGWLLPLPSLERFPGVQLREPVSLGIFYHTSR